MTGEGAALFHLLQLIFEIANAAADVPPVGLQLGFTGTPGADAAAQPGKGGALPRQPGQEVLQLCQLHLQPPFGGMRPAGENVQDQGGTVHHPHAGQILQIAVLGGGQLPVKDQQVDVVVLAYLPDLLQTACADAGGRVGGGTPLQHGAAHLRARGAGQLRQLFQRDLGVEIPGVQRDQQRPFRGRFGVLFRHAAFLIHWNPPRNSVYGQLMEKAAPSGSSRGGESAPAGGISGDSTGTGVPGCRKERVEHHRFPKVYTRIAVAAIIYPHMYQYTACPIRKYAPLLRKRPVVQRISFFGHRKSVHSSSFIMEKKNRPGGTAPSPGTHHMVCF